MIRNRGSLFITGFMGAGKTTIARYLSSRMGLPWMDIDSHIQKQENCTIAELFRKQGEDRFRHLERQAVANIKQPHIVSLGGGAFLQSGIREIISQSGISIFLDVPFELLWTRVSGQKKRPLVQSYGELKLLYQKRYFYYLLSDFTCHIDALSFPVHTVNHILNFTRLSK